MLKCPTLSPSYRPPMALTFSTSVPVRLLLHATQNKLETLADSSILDYVFDGTKPPYEVDDAPNPVNFYGKTKRQGEVAIESVEGPGQRVIVRVPVL